jgi:CBS domain-containing protein
MLKLRDVMSTDVVILPPEATLRAAMDLLTARHISGAPVVAGHDVVGVISATDLLRFAAAMPGVPTARPGAEPEADLDEGAAAPDWGPEDQPPAAFFADFWEDAGADVSERFTEVSGPEWDVLEEHTVSEAMNPTILSMPSNTTVDRAADYMRSAGVHRLLVMDEGVLAGIVSTKDIADAVADHKLSTRTYVFGARAERDERGWEG